MLNVDPEIQAAIDEERQLDERVLWTGKPNPLRFAMREPARLLGALGSVLMAGLFLFIFSQFFGEALPISFNTERSTMPFGGFSSFFILILVLIVGSSVGPVILDFLKAGRMVYAVTTKRLMIVTLPWAWWGKSVQSFGENDIQMLSRSGSDEQGDLVFASESYRVRQKYGYSTRTRKVGFFGIPDVRTVEQLVMTTFKR